MLNVAIEYGYLPYMALEVRELIIRVTVQDEAAADLQRLGEELTQTCVRQVLAELQRRRER